MIALSDRTQYNLLSFKENNPSITHHEQHISKKQNFAVAAAIFGSKTPATTREGDNPYYNEDIGDLNFYMKTGFQTFTLLNTRPCTLDDLIPQSD